MKSLVDGRALALTLACALPVALALGGDALAQQNAAAKKTQTAKETVALSQSQVQARAILTRMAEFLGATQRLSVRMRSGYDAVQQSGQKLEFGESRSVTLARPDRLRVEGQRSDGSKVQIVFTGKEIMLVDATSNVYATTPQVGGLDESITHFVGDLGMRMPLAVLLLSRLPAELQARVESIDYVEQTSINGAPAHHLAARSATVDFQVWVADGDKPLPQRVVITYKLAQGQPQYWAVFSDWNLTPAIDERTFATSAPAGAQKVAFAAELPRVVAAARKSKTEKGAKQ